MKNVLLITNVKQASLIKEIFTHSPYLSIGLENITVEKSFANVYLKPTATYARMRPDHLFQLGMLVAKAEALNNTLHLEKTA
jgi:hypothetical protein